MSLSLGTFILILVFNFDTINMDYVKGASLASMDNRYFVSLMAIAQPNIVCKNARAIAGQIPLLDPSLKSFF